MSAGIISTYDVKAGRNPEASAFLQEAARYMSGLADGSAHVRTLWLAGEAAGQLQLITQYPTVSAQMAGFDAIMADIANNPLARLGSEKRLPLRLRSRYTYSSLDETAGVATPPPVMGTRIFQIAPGKRAAAGEAFAAAERLHNGMGVTARALEIANAGPQTGVIAYAVGLTSYAAMGTFAANVAKQDVRPLFEASGAGTLIAGAQQSSVLMPA